MMQTMHLTPTFLPAPIRPVAEGQLPWRLQPSSAAPGFVRWREFLCPSYRPRFNFLGLIYFTLSFLCQFQIDVKPFLKKVSHT